MSSEAFNSINNPKYITKNFTKKILFKSIKDKNFLDFLYNGNKQTTELQKKFSADYWDYLFNSNMEYILNIIRNRKRKKECITNIINLLDKYGILDSATKGNYLITKINFKKKQVSKLKRTLTLILKNFYKCKTLSLKDKNLMNIIKSIKNTFFDVEIGLPQSHYYTAMVGFSRSFGITNVISVNVNNIFLLHKVDGISIKKTKHREKAVISLINKSIKNLGNDLSKYTLNQLIKKYIPDVTKSPLFSSSSPLSISYPKSDGTYHDDFYIFVEGNGRLVALKMAYYKISKKNPNFVPPKLKINNSKIKSKIGIKNQYYFVLLCWANWFPKNTVKGFQNQMQKGRLHYKNKYIVNRNPFNYGFVDENSNIPELSIDFLKRKTRRIKKKTKKRKTRRRKMRT
jgi:hypothetical protein